jgi:hypothetical protein
MDTKQLIASIVGSIAGMIGSLAWPFAIFFSLLLFRTPITSLLGRVKKLVAPGVNMDFSELVAEVAVEGQRVEVEAGRSLGDIIALDEAVLQLIHENPEAAVRGEYQQLESVIQQLWFRLPDDKPSENKNLYMILFYLRDAGIISKSVVNLWEKIRIARYGVKDRAMTAEDAMVLIRETRMLTSLLRSIGKQFTSPPEIPQKNPRP